MPLPVSKNKALAAVTWMKHFFKDKMLEAVEGTPFSIDTLCGIACQETAYVWVDWVNSKSMEDILKLCVFDASGDYPNTSRSAFPKNTAAFRSKYGDDFTEMLIGEANKSRAARGLQPRSWVYKGYGIYQYDLQHVKTDEDFFRNRSWYQYENCLRKVMMELNFKWSVYKDMFRTIKGYNGSGPRAEAYANNVIIFTSYSKEVTV